MALRDQFLMHDAMLVQY